MFARTYKDMKGIPPELVQHIIELETSIPPIHQVRYRLNPNHVVVVKHDIDTLIATRFIQLVDEVTWLSPIVVVPKKNKKLRICVDFKKLNKVTKKNPYPLPFFYEVLNIVVGYETYSFLDGYSGYHLISVALENRYKITFCNRLGSFCLDGDAIWCQKWATNIPKSNQQKLLESTYTSS
jgi:hypothetical protein